MESQPPAELGEHLFLLVVGVLILLGVLVRVSSRRLLGMPPAVGYIALGFGLRVFHAAYHLPADQQWALAFLGELGVASLLFQVGLRSDTRSLQAELPAASVVWVSNVVVAAVAGFMATRWLGFDIVPALFVGAALSATSVGISVSVWSEQGRMRSKLGALLLDVAELDDLSAVVMMLAVVAAAPALAIGGDPWPALQLAGDAMGAVLLKFALFVAGCFLFARYAEEPLTRVLSEAQQSPERVLMLVGVGFSLAAIAGWLGFSTAVGALFAGLMFSRDPRAVHQEASFGPIYALFTPFFFIHIGFGMDPSVMGESLELGLWLFLPAVIGKLIGAGAPLWRSWGGASSMIFGVSMVPRAEIALLIMDGGQRLGAWAVPAKLYGGMVVACALTSVLAPLLLERLLRTHPHVGEFGHGRF